MGEESTLWGQGGIMEIIPPLESPAEVSKNYKEMFICGTAVHLSQIVIL